MFSIIKFIVQNQISEQNVNILKNDSLGGLVQESSIASRYTGRLKKSGIKELRKFNDFVWYVHEYKNERSTFYQISIYTEILQNISWGNVCLQLSHECKTEILHNFRVSHQMRLQLSPHKLIPRRSFITHLVLHEPTKEEHRI